MPWNRGKVKNHIREKREREGQIWKSLRGQGRGVDWNNITHTHTKKKAAQHKIENEEQEN